MARVVLVLFFVTICAIQLSSAEISGSELYSKLRSILKDRRVQQTVHQVERDLEEAREDADDEERLTAELMEERKLETESILATRQGLRSGGDVWKRVLELRQFQLKKQPWFAVKPSEELLDRYCPLRYDSVWLTECEYFIKNRYATKGVCKTFCETWQRNSGATKACPFDNFYDEEFCRQEREKFDAKGTVGCDVVCGGTVRLSKSCCGYCRRSCSDKVKDKKPIF